MEDHYMTVGKLKKQLKNYPDDAKVFYQRIEDEYFKPGKGWLENSIKKPSQHSGYPGEFLDEYTQVFGCVKYPCDSNLYLTAHY